MLQPSELRKEKDMRINVHAGHNPDGKIACGAIGFIRESTEARKVKDEVIAQLRQMGHTVYDCTCNSGTGQLDVLEKIVSACNTHKVDLDVSIHFNAGVRDNTGNGRTTGTEVMIYNNAGRAREAAERTCASISALGFKNRGIKPNTGLYFLRNTKAPAMLVERCFVDDKDDAELYDCQKMASAIVRGITGMDAVWPKDDPQDKQVPEATESGVETAVGDGKSIYRVQVGAYSIMDNAKNMQKELKAAGFDAVLVKA